jgi:hypothetical protein
MPTVNGTKGAYPQPAVIGEDSSGQYTEVRYEGTTKEINALVPSLRAAHATWKITRSFTGAKDTLEARIPMPVNLFGTNEPEIPVDEWELFSQDVEKEMIESNSTVVESLTENERAGLKQYIIDPGPDTIPARLPGSNLDKLVKLAIAGVHSIVVSVPTLRHTQTVSANWTTKAAMTNVHKLFTTAALMTSEGVPSDVLFDMPQEVSVRADQTFAWMKKYPTVRISSKNKRQIEQEWVYGLWSTLLYGDPIDPAFLLA